MAQTDRELVERCRAGDDEAFHALVRKYAPRVFEVIHRMTADAATAEDLLQDALIQAYKALSRFRGDSSFYTWLYRIGVNQALGWLRKTKGRGTVSLDDDEAPLEVADYTETPERSSEQRELGDTIEDAVSKLGDNIRIVFVLREQEGLSFEEIAQMLDCSQEVVRARLFRAKKALKVMLRPYLEPLVGATSGRREDAEYA